MTSGALGADVIKCDDVHKFYLAGERSVYALKGIDLEVREREFVSIVGKSGCGKSTLLHCIAGLLPVSHGQIWINGEEVKKPGSRDIGLVFQTSALLRWRSTLENVTSSSTPSPSRRSKSCTRRMRVSSKR